MRSSATSKPDKQLRLRVFWGDILYDTRLLKNAGAISIGSRDDNDFVIDTGSSHPRWVLAKPGRRSTEIRLLPKQEGFFQTTAQEIVPFRLMDGKKITESLGGGSRSFNLLDNEGAELVFEHCTFSFDWVEPTADLQRATVFTGKTMGVSGIVGSLLLMTSLLMENLPPVPVPVTPQRLVTLVRAEPVVEMPLPPKPDEPEIETEPDDEASEPAEVLTVVREKTKEAKQSTPPGKIKKSVAQTLVTKVPVRPPPGLSGANDAEWEALGTDLSRLNAKNTKTPALAPKSRGSAVGPGMVSIAAPAIAINLLEEKMGSTEGQGSGVLEPGVTDMSVSAIEKQRKKAGTPDRAVIERFVQSRERQLKSCYQNELALLQKKSGYLNVRFTIEATGEVKNPKIVDDTLGSNAVARCVVQEMATWVFPKPKDGLPVRVEFPFVFENH